MIPVSKDSALTWISPLLPPPGGGTYEGAYDNTAGTVAVMLYAKALLEIEVRCDTFLALWSSEEEFCEVLTPLLTMTAIIVYQKTRNLRFYINMDMMGISYPAKKANGDYFPYHAWSYPDFDPEVQDVAITTILDYVHRDVLKAPMDLRIEWILWCRL